MFQKISLIGRLGQEPSMRYMPNGDPVTSFSVATDRVYTKNDQKVKDTIWFRVSVFGRQAENCNQYLDKGKLVYVEGRLNADAETGGPRLYTAQDGTTRASFDIVAGDVRFLSPKGDGGSNGEPATDSDSDIPF